MLGRLGVRVHVTVSRHQQLLLRQRHAVQERLHRRLAVAPPALVRPGLVILHEPRVEIHLKLVQARVESVGNISTLRRLSGAGSPWPGLPVRLLRFQFLTRADSF